MYFLLILLFPSQGPYNIYLNAFSAYANGTLLFKRKENESSSRNMACLNGIRVLSIVWVVFAHSYMIQAIGPLINAVDLYKVDIIIETKSFNDTRLS